MPKFLVILFIFLGIGITTYTFSDVNKISDAISPICEESNNFLNNSGSRLFKKSNTVTSKTSMYSFRNEIVNSQINNLDILIYDSKDWFLNLERASMSNTSLSEEYKKNFLAKVVFSNGLDNCNLSAKVRVSGDYLDHIEEIGDTGLYISSIELSLTEGNIYRNKKIKLFLPQTRGGQNEVLITTFLDQLGFLAPDTFFIDVNINGLSHRYLFQEKIIDGFLLNKNKKEGPILEAKTPHPSIWDKKSIDLARIINDKWLLKNKYNLQYGYKALEIYSKMRIFHDKKNHALLDLNLEYLNTESQHQLRQFLLLNLVLENWHSLDVGNRKFYIDPLDDTVYPIYYDGGSKFLDNKLDYYLYSDDKNSFCAGYMLDESYLEDIYILQKQINNLDMGSLILNLKNRGLAKENLLFLESRFKEVITERLIALEKNIFRNYTRNNYSTIEYFQKSPNNYEDYLLMFHNDSNFEYCDTSLKSCKETNLTIEDEINLVNGNYFIDEKRVYFVGSSIESIKNNIKENKIFSNATEVSGFTIFSNNKIEYKLNNKNLELFAKSDSRYLIKNSEIFDLKITLIYKHDKNIVSDNEALRYDELFLTGCLNIYDSSLRNVSITISNTQCEDSINLVRTQGSVDELFITNATYDALDVDFSNLVLRSIKVNSALNDCIDVSKGSYLFNYIKVENCGDKGFSTGEGSSVEIKNLIVDKSTIGIAVKDSSNVYIDELEVSNSIFCTSLYRKKQEFGPSRIEVNNLFCNSGATYAQKDSYTLYHARN